MSSRQMSHLSHRPDPSDPSEAEMFLKHQGLAKRALKRLRLEPRPEFGQDDAFNAALFGLVRAIRTWSAEKAAAAGAEFATFAAKRISGEVVDAYRDATKCRRRPESLARTFPLIDDIHQAAAVGGFDARHDAEVLLAALPAPDAEFIRRIYWDGVLQKDALPARSEARASQKRRQILKKLRNAFAGTAIAEGAVA